MLMGFAMGMVMAPSKKDAKAAEKKGAREKNAAVNATAW